MAGTTGLGANCSFANTAIANLTSCVNGSLPEVETFEFEKVVRIIVPILFGIIILLGLFGNSLVVIVVAANKQMRSTTNLLIINLAIADLLFIIFCVPFTATDYIFVYWPFGETWCKIVQYLIVVTAYASVYTLVLMSLDRFLAVVHPIASITVRTERNAIVAILVTWIIILVGNIYALISHGVVTYEYSMEEHSVCIFREESMSKIYQISFFIMSYLLPLTAICGLYLRMLVRLWGGSAPGGKCSVESRRGKRRVTRMVLVVVAIFAICWCPIQVILVLKTVGFYPITYASVMVQIVSQVLAYINSCVNPILYAFLSENFRKAFRKVIYCGPEGAVHHQNNINGQHIDQEKSALTKTTRSNDIL